MKRPTRRSRGIDLTTVVASTILLAPLLLAACDRTSSSEPAIILVTPDRSMNPVLRHAADLGQDQIGERVWDPTHNADWTARSPDGLTASRRPPPGYDGDPPLWIAKPSSLRLHSGAYELDVHVAELGRAQIGIGFLLEWDIGQHVDEVAVDWGFYGYLGSSSSAWAYDPTTGDVVTATESIEGGLPTLDGEGTITLVADLPRDSAGRAWFRVEGVDSSPIELPAGAVIVPAATFLTDGQRATLGELRPHAP